MNSDRHPTQPMNRREFWPVTRPEYAANKDTRYGIWHLKAPYMNMNSSHYALGARFEVVMICGQQWPENDAIYPVAPPQENICKSCLKAQAALRRRMDVI